ncbi:MAG: hypothetical protein H7838_09275 [Magnetococcus sp. DMHC-8]
MINRTDLQHRLVPISMDGTLFLTTRTATVQVGATQTIYLGFAYPGSNETDSVWLIQRTSVAADGTTTTLFAGGRAVFDQVWADRLNLSYA